MKIYSKMLIAALFAGVVGPLGAAEKASADSFVWESFETAQDATNNGGYTNWVLADSALTSHGISVWTIQDEAAPILFGDTVYDYTPGQVGAAHDYINSTNFLSEQDWVYDFDGIADVEVDLQATHLNHDAVAIANEASNKTAYRSINILSGWTSISIDFGYNAWPSETLDPVPWNDEDQWISIGIFNSADTGLSTDLTVDGFLTPPSPTFPDPSSYRDMSTATISLSGLTPGTYLFGVRLNTTRSVVDFAMDNIVVTFTPGDVPEPTTLALVGAGLGALAVRRGGRRA